MPRSLRRPRGLVAEINLIADERRAALFNACERRQFYAHKNRSVVQAAHIVANQKTIPRSAFLLRTRIGNTSRGSRNTFTRPYGAAQVIFCVKLPLMLFHQLVVQNYLKTIYIATVFGVVGGDFKFPFTIDGCTNKSGKFGRIFGCENVLNEFSIGKNKLPAAVECLIKRAQNRRLAIGRGECDLGVGGVAVKKRQLDSIDVRCAEDCGIVKTLKPHLLAPRRTIQSLRRRFVIIIITLVTNCNISNWHLERNFFAEAHASIRLADVVAVTAKIRRLAHNDLRDVGNRFAVLLHRNTQHIRAALLVGILHRRNARGAVVAVVKIPKIRRVASLVASGSCGGCQGQNVLRAGLNQPVVAVYVNGLRHCARREEHRRND